MIRSEDVVAYPHVGNTLHESSRNEKVVQSPADVPAAGVESVGPPGVLFRGVVEFPEGILETGLDQIVHPGPFFLGEPGVFAIG